MFALSVFPLFCYSISFILISFLTKISTIIHGTANWQFNIYNITLFLPYTASVFICIWQISILLFPYLHIFFLFGLARFYRTFWWFFFFRQFMANYIIMNNCTFFFNITLFFWEPNLIVLFILENQVGLLYGIYFP